MGFFEDPIAIMVEIFTLSLVCILMFFVVAQVSGMFDVIQNANVVQGYTNAVGQGFVASFGILDQAILLVMVFLMLVALILAWYIPSHPSFILGYIVVVVVLVMMAPLFTNVYSTIVNNSVLLPYAVQFPIANTIMENLVLIMVVFSAMLAVVSYGKPRTDQANVLQGLG